MRLRMKISPHNAGAGKNIFRFEVRLLSGPVTEAFVSRHPEPPSRVLDIRGSQTLGTLHQAIFDAFDRDDPHMYEFQIGGKKPMDKKAVHYGIALEDDDFGRGEDAETTAIASLALQVGGVFFYWFDFGDDWWHEIRLLAINPPPKGGGRYPRLLEKNGESPPQYADWDEDEEEACQDRAPVPLRDADTTPAALEEEQRRGAIAALVQEFCETRLTPNYADVCTRLLDAIRAAWLPVQRGKAQSWAAGLVHAAGAINFLHDPASEPYMKLGDIAQHFGVSPATMSNKSREIQDAVNAFPLDPRFCLPELLADNPFVWLCQVNGIVVDMRTQPRDVQEAALKAGMIPFLPEPAVTARAPKQKAKNPKKKG